MHPLKQIALAAALATAGSAAHAAMVLSSPFLVVTIDDDGHLGAGSAGPGIVFDPSGTASFAGRPDHVSPGTAFEGFGVRIGKDATVRGNANSAVPGLVAIASSPLLSTGTGTSRSVAWTGAAAGLFTLRHEYAFTQGGTTLSVRTTVTALDDLKDLRFARALDPDADAALVGGSHDTDNLRGDAPAGLAPDDAVRAFAPLSGHGIELLHVAGGGRHSTAISADFAGPLDPDFLLGGNADRNDRPLGDASFGDHAIGLAYDLGNLDRGDSVSFEYAYRAWFTAPVDGGTGDTGGGTVPVPSTLALLALALVAPSMRRGR